eukprot:COSAG04_NODE_522_length_13154_cov_27.623592_2_plen_128_part_00
MVKNRMSDPRGAVKIDNPQKTSHCPPPTDAHGLVLPNPSRAAYCGGVSSGKTCALLCTLGECHQWKPFEHIYLMGPNLEDMVKGEYQLVDVTPLDHFPTLDYFAKRPGRSVLTWSHSVGGSFRPFSP